MLDKQNINLLVLLEQETTLKRVAGTNGGEYKGPCPFCGGKDRFMVQPKRSGDGRWLCRQCSPHWQDAIEYVKRRDGCDFKTACQVLSIALDGKPRPRRKAFKRRPTQSQRRATPSKKWLALTDASWQHHANDFCNICREYLWDSDDTTGLTYLHERGLNDATIEAFKLGYNPTPKWATWGSNRVGLRGGIVIPWNISGTLWRVNVRLLTEGHKLKDDDDKYRGPAGFANGLYNAGSIGQHTKTVVMVEGEFDAMLLWQETRATVPDVMPVATGAATGSHLNDWIALLAVHGDRVLLAFDNDKAGQEAAAWWGDVLGDKTKRLVPTAHDITDMWHDGKDLTAWITEALEEGVKVEFMS